MMEWLKAAYNDRTTVTGKIFIGNFGLIVEQTSQDMCISQGAHIFSCNLILCDTMNNKHHRMKYRFSAFYTFAMSCCQSPGITGETRQIQVANRIKFGSRSFRSIEYERIHDFYSKQFSC